MRSRWLLRCFLLLWVLVAAAVAMAAPRLPAVFSDNMVLQRGQALPVWGWAEPGEEVVVGLAGQSAKATACKAGKWQVKLAAMEAGGPHELVVQGKDKSIAVKNVLVGEVWVCSGQSNMEWPVAASVNAPEEAAAANFPQIRMFTVAKKVADQPQDDCQGSWTVCSPQTVPGFSAVGYFFARKLHQDLGVPVGMINASWGGTPAESWTSRKALESESCTVPILQRWEKNTDQKNPWRPASLYNGMIAPVVPYAIRGAIWYQGESNIGRAWQYRTLMPLLIRDWRAAWGQGDFPFGLVQLAPFTYGPAAAIQCAELREAQTLTVLNTPNVGMAVTMDIGNPKDIHPKNKQDVGKRLGLWALAKVYGKPVVYSGPMYKSMAVEGNKVRIRFDHVGSGLVTRDGKAPTHFTVAGADQKFHPATAAIDGDSVVVHSDQVPQPVAVRYAWKDDDEPNLANKEGLPASPFRTDSWKSLTEGIN
ncbi:MAG: sialate O-acetylesterase [Thermoguttaceae bacterium]|jgi:sialate O-acetylesterase|nr:sialate O-acetylesterase [Thermoguttaceae bacterium]